MCVTDDDSDKDNSENESETESGHGKHKKSDSSAAVTESKLLTDDGSSYADYRRQLTFYAI